MKRLHRKIWNNQKKFFVNSPQPLGRFTTKIISGLKITRVLLVRKYHLRSISVGLIENGIFRPSTLVTKVWW